MVCRVPASLSCHCSNLSSVCKNLSISKIWNLIEGFVRLVFQQSWVFLQMVSRKPKKKVLHFCGNQYISTIAAFLFSHSFYWGGGGREQFPTAELWMIGAETSSWDLSRFGLENIRKVAKFSTTTFTYRSTSYLFYALFLHSDVWEQRAANTACRDIGTYTYIYLNGLRGAADSVSRYFLSSLLCVWVCVKYY